MNRKEAADTVREWAEAIERVAPHKETEFSRLLHRIAKIEPGEKTPEDQIGERDFQRMRNFLANTDFRRGEFHYEIWSARKRALRVLLEE